MFKDQYKAVPEEITPMHYKMNPHTEDLIRGKELLKGMYVLVEPVGLGVDPTAHELGADHECDNYKCPRILRDQRWCMVTDLEVHRDGEVMSFIGWYSDGTKQTRTYNRSFNWYVKLVDSFGNFLKDPNND